MVQVFGSGDSVPPRTAFGDSVPSPNYMYYHGASIRFGKLTMTGTDLLIVDADPGDPFGFYLGRYHEQLVAGNVVNQIVEEADTSEWAKVALERMLAIT